jgi:TPR repeat protein
MSDSIDWTKEPDLLALHHAIDVAKENPSEGRDLLLALAKKGSLHSMVHLGYLYAHHLHGAEGLDVSEAEYWYRLACEAGSEAATFHLGRLYLKASKIDKAREAFEIGLQLGYAPSIFHLGRIYRDGLGVATQWDRARTMFERAASLNHIYAKRALGRLLLTGYFGFWERFKGLNLVIRAALEATKEIQKNPGSERLKM